MQRQYHSQNGLAMFFRRTAVKIQNFELELNFSLAKNGNFSEKISNKSLLHDVTFESLSIQISTQNFGTSLTLSDE